MPLVVLVGELLGGGTLPLGRVATGFVSLTRVRVCPSRGLEYNWLLCRGPRCKTTALLIYGLVFIKKKVEDKGFELKYQPKQRLTISRITRR
jgi:hypothetical protein